MPLLTQRNANIISSVGTVWLGLVAANQIPDNVYTHWISVAMMGCTQFLVHMGFNRTPQGNVIPEPVSKFVDKSFTDN